LKTKAVDSYTGKNGIRLNCAQSVARAAKDEYGVSETEIETLKAFSGGCAPEGMCGAIYAAHWLIARKSSEAAEEAVNTFNEAIGETRCREIRSARKRSCMDCVAEAAFLAEKYMLMDKA
jgi:hypothetical protein